MRAVHWGLCWACAIGSAALGSGALAQAPAAPQPKAAETKAEAEASKPSKPKAKHAKKAEVASKDAVSKGGKDSAPAAEPKPVVAVSPAAPATPPPSAATPPPKPVCKLAEAEQPRGGRLEVLSDAFGKSPVVSIAGRPARMIERREDRVSVQVPADSDGGPITLLHDGHSSKCGNLVIIGKNR